MGPFLTKILMENNQEIPEFLQHFKPEDGILNFDEEEEDPDMVTTDGGPDGAAWGSGEGGNANAGGDTGAAGDARGSGTGNAAAPAPAETWGTTGGDAFGASSTGGW
jgi:ATP-dependent RNA helicase DDX3X